MVLSRSKSIKSIRRDYYNHRLYPYNELAAQVIGFTNKDNQGIYGIEGYFDNILNGLESEVEYNKNSRGRRVFSKNSLLPNDGSDIVLTIDINIQDILQHELKEVFLENNAKSANGIIIDPYNGEIIAMASIPDFNLNTTEIYLQILLNIIIKIVLYHQNMSLAQHLKLFVFLQLLIIIKIKDINIFVRMVIILGDTNNLSEIMTPMIL